MIKIDVKSGIDHILDKKKMPRPVSSNHCSSLDDPCLRRLYYRRTAWEKATPVDTGLAGIWATGNKLEPVIETIIQEVGMASTPRWRIIAKQVETRDTLLDEHNITGTIDGLLQAEIEDVWTTLGVVDIKTMSPHIYPNINCYADLDRYSWTRRYKGQLQLYSLAHNYEHCFILCVCKQNLYDLKLIDFPVDMEYCDKLLAKAKTVNLAVKAETPPDQINHPDQCEDCQFAALCCPSYSTGGNISIEVHEELEEVLDKLDTFDETRKEINELEKRRDFLLVKGKNIIIGRHIITWKQSKNSAWRKKIVSTNTMDEASKDAPGGG